MSYAAAEIASQPQVWRRGLEVAAAEPAGLPLRGERVAVVGCGTSWFMAQSYAALREAAGHGDTDAWPASEFGGRRDYDRVVALTRTGTTSEVVEALGRVRPGVPTAAVVAEADTPVARAVKHAIVLDFADERAVVQTRFPTTLLLMLRAHLGQDVANLPDQAAQALAAPLPAAAGCARQITYLGTGWTVGLANEAALKAREAAQVWVESYPAMEYRHGPISVADERSLVWMFGEPPAGLARDVAATGAALELSTLDPLADLVRAQRLAVELAQRNGLDPDTPRHLSRSIILP